MLPATRDEIKDIEEYFKWQAPDLEITFSQKVYAETILGNRHEVWDIHTNNGRWWVITKPTNLYSQDQFPNLDLAVTFHVGLCIRLPRTSRPPVPISRALPFSELMVGMMDIHESLSQAKGTKDYQAVGMRCRETLLDFIAAAQDAAVWTDGPQPQRANFKGWADVICDKVLGGGSQRERRHFLKLLMKECWDFSAWLTHSQTATWHDAEMCLTTSEQCITIATSIIIRALKEVPEACPQCDSPSLSPEEGFDPNEPNVVWERPTCEDCGWSGNPVPIAERDAAELALLVQERQDQPDECLVPTAPLRGLQRPSSG